MIDLVAFIPRAIQQGIPLLFGSTGETITEKSGNLNLGIPGVMYVGGICGVIGSFNYEQACGGKIHLFNHHIIGSAVIYTCQFIMQSLITQPFYVFLIALFKGLFLLLHILACM